MKVSTIATSYERKFNMGDYNSLKLEVTIWADLEEGDKSEDCTRALQAQCREAVRAEYGRLKPSVKPNEQIEARAQIAETVTTQ